MSVFKKVVLSSAVLMGMALSAGANAAVTTVSWEGEVPGSIGDGTHLITGENGDLTALYGVIQPNADGQFVSEAIKLESYVDNGGTIGEATPVNWQVEAFSVTYDNAEVDSQLVTAVIDGDDYAVGDSTGEKDNISVQIKQEAQLTAEEVAGKTVKASLTLVTSVV
ncbi:hypothetical protein AB8613_14890 [Vibrio sp. BS-M-Sm-2]|uniref:hypothetical protein n=1 Tax=Vibrio sp. BS-M-Sm-2 TaxID=3241167 RepID=UPI0035577B00